MFNSNAPDNYECPICIGLSGAQSENTLIAPTDIVYKDDIVTVLINSFFMGRNVGHVIVVPNEHYENIYDLPIERGHRVQEVTQRIATVIKQSYRCDGITVRQNNEPAGDQHAFHFHQHIFPRYIDDGFNSLLPKDKRLAPPEERAQYAEKLRSFLF